MKVQVLTTCEELTGGEVYMSAGEVITHHVKCPGAQSIGGDREDPRPQPIGQVQRPLPLGLERHPGKC